VQVFEDGRLIERSVRHLLRRVFVDLELPALRIVLFGLEIVLGESPLRHADGVLLTVAGRRPIHGVEVGEAELILKRCTLEVSN
jgi:hypothetical protein